VEEQVRICPKCRKHKVRLVYPQGEIVYAYCPECDEQMLNENFVTVPERRIERVMADKNVSDPRILAR
jgi:hypothetical protein